MQLNLFQDSSSPLASMAQQQKQHVHIINVVEWFSQDGDELKMWCSEFDTLACRDHINLARQAMRVNVLWKQPQLLRLHQQFDQIFQVKLGFSEKATKFEKNLGRTFDKSVVFCAGNSVLVKKSTKIF